MIEGTDPGILGYGTEETVQIGTVKKQKRKNPGGIEMDVSVKRVNTKKELDAAVEDAMVEGWTVKTTGNQNAVMKKHGGFGGLLGHALVLLFTCWFTFGIGNLIYAGIRYVTGAQELRIKIVEK